MRVTDRETLGLRLLVRDAVGQGVRDVLPLPEAEMEALRDGEADCEAETLADADSVSDGLKDGEALNDEVDDEDREGDALQEGVVDGLADRLEDGDGDALLDCALTPVMRPAHATRTTLIHHISAPRRRGLVAGILELCVPTQRLACRCNEPKATMKLPLSENCGAFPITKEVVKRLNHAIDREQLNNRRRRLRRRSLRFADDSHEIQLSLRFFSFKR